MKPDNIEKIIIEHKAFGHGRSHDEWWEVTVKYYEPLRVEYETSVYNHYFGEYITSTVVTQNEKERFVLHSIDEVLSFMQKNRQEFK